LTSAAEQEDGGGLAAEALARVQIRCGQWLSRSISSTVKSHLPSLIRASLEAGGVGYNDGDGRIFDHERYFYLLESLISTVAWFG
jgi:hypothetical protein